MYSRFRFTCLANRDLVKVGETTAAATTITTTSTKESTSTTTEETTTSTTTTTTTTTTETTTTTKEPTILEIVNQGSTNGQRLFFFTNLFILTAKMFLSVPTCCCGFLKFLSA
jgi:hypothetical protein